MIRGITTLLLALFLSQLMTAPVCAQEPTLEERVRQLEAALEKEKTDQEKTDQEKKEKEPAWTLLWKDGFRLTSPDGRQALSFGGRIQNDWAFFSAAPQLAAAAGGFDDGTEFRRARLFFSGKLYDRVELKAEYDFAGGESTFKDVYLGLFNLPVVGGVRLGHFKEPFALGELESTNYPTFLERALPVEAFAPSRNTGILLHRSEPRWSVAAGSFLESDDFGNSLEGDAWGHTLRVTGVPWLAAQARQLVHVGLAWSEREPVGQVVRYRSRPESHLAPRLVDSGTFAADAVRLAGVELIVIAGPLSLQGEHLEVEADRPVGGAVDLAGSYVQASWFLTGESRPYRSAGAVYDRLRPARELGKGPGAWEVALRYSTLDLAAAPAGNRLDDLTLALNWYPYSNVRVMLNYVRADPSGDGGELDVVQARFQVDF